jgi:hypothetical protein
MTLEEAFNWLIKGGIVVARTNERGEKIYARTEAGRSLSPQALKALSASARGNH